MEVNSKKENLQSDPLSREALEHLIAIYSREPVTHALALRAFRELWNRREAQGRGRKDEDTNQSVNSAQYNRQRSMPREYEMGIGWMMSEWISVKDRLPRLKQNVDLWIKGEAVTVDFYDPARKKTKSKNGIKEGRTTDWFLCDDNWYSVGGLVPRLSGAVRVTHWMPRPDPPTEKPGA